MEELNNNNNTDNNSNAAEETEISQLGEFGLINALTANLPVINESTIKSVGDDAAVIAYGDSCTVVSTDMFVEGVHFDFMYTPLQHLGYKCITGSISDIYAMNAIPQQVVVSLAVSSRFTVQMLEEIYKGMRIACENYGVDLVGGDTTSSRSGLVINITALGSEKKEKITYRSGAKPHDILVVTGDLGGAYIGLQILEREKRVYLSNPEIQPELGGYDYVLRRQLRPEARKDIIMDIFQKLNLQPTSMIDISDGLASEIMHICKQSGTGCTLYEEKIPFDPQTYNTARVLGLDATVCALSGGEDYELLFTLHPSEFEKVANHPDFTVIGHIDELESGCNLVTKSNNRYPLQAQGWKHF